MVEFPDAPVSRSYSSFTSWLSCGKSWQLARVVKVPETPAWYLVGGSAVHSATEAEDRQRFAEVGI